MKVVKIIADLIGDTKGVTILLQCVKDLLVGTRKYCTNVSATSKAGAVFNRKISRTSLTAIGLGSNFPSGIDHSLTVLSRLPEARIELSGLKATVRMKSV